MTDLDVVVRTVVRRAHALAVRLCAPVAKSELREALKAVRESENLRTASRERDS